MSEGGEEGASSIGDDDGERTLNLRVNGAMSVVWQAADALSGRESAGGLAWTSAGEVEGKGCWVERREARGENDVGCAEAG